jgi:hypothetical protein
MGSHFPLSYGCQAAGPEAVSEALDELGQDALDKNVRAALASTIASALAERGVIQIEGI